MTERERDALLLEMREAQREQGKMLQGHGARLERIERRAGRIERKIDEVDNRVSDLRQELAEQGMVASDDSPEEATG